MFFGGDCGAVQDDEFPMTQGTDIWVHRIMQLKFILLISLSFSDYHRVLFAFYIEVNI